MNLFRITLLASAIAALAGCQSSPEKPADTPQQQLQTAPTPQAVRAAHSAGERERAQFIAQHDSDGDGKVSLAEYKQFRASRFNDGDSDGKGYLSEDDYVDEYATRLEQQLEDERKAHIKQTKARFESLDSDKDGFISRAEYDASGARMFAHLDKDNSGVISASSEEAAMRPGSQLAMPTSHNAQGFLALYDQDGDGKVTRGEFDSQRLSAFNATDSNGDGRLSYDEYLDEYLARLDGKAEAVRKAQLKQAVVRFNVIDTNKDKRIDSEEYWAVGLRTFNLWDTNGDGVISQDDPLPQPRMPEGNKRADKKAAN